MSVERFTVSPGDIFRDTDPRMSDRHLKVVSADSRHATVINCAADGGQGTGRKTRVSLKGLETRFARVGGSCQREDLERAAIAALKAWRVADAGLREATKQWRAGDTAETYQAYCAAQVAARNALGALCAAADALEGEG